MTPEDERALIIQRLQRAEQIERETRELQSLTDTHELDPLHSMSREVIEAVEAEYHAAHGRQKHIGADGRVRWLTAEQVEARRTGRRKNKRQSRYYGPTSNVDQRVLVRWGFNIAAVLIGLAIVAIVVL